MKGIFRKKQCETDSIFSFFFEPETPLSWDPGQYTTISLPSGKRMFTISSAPEEHAVRITTRIPGENPSPFKNALSLLHPGDAVELSLAQGKFLAGLTPPAVFLAGGIGITPFRSFLFSEQGKNLNPTVYHVSTNTPPLFSQEFHASSIPVTHAAHLQEIPIESPDALFALAGPEGFVWSALKLLAERGVPKENIRREEFTGY